MVNGSTHVVIIIIMYYFSYTVLKLWDLHTTYFKIILLNFLTTSAEELKFYFKI